MSFFDETGQKGFNFENYKRNMYNLPSDMTKSSLNSYKKTGTTIVGVVCKDGVVLATDTRATGGSTVMEKNCQKLHYMAPNIWCAGAGTAADCDKVTEKIEKELTLLRLNTGRQSRVSTVVARLVTYLHRHMGYLGAYLIMGGVDPTGNHLCQIAANG